MSKAESNMESAPKRKPKVGPITLAARMSANHIGSIPIAPIPSGRSAATNALRMPRKATFFEPRSSAATSPTNSRTVNVVDAKKIMASAPYVFDTTGKLPQAHGL